MPDSKKFYDYDILISDDISPEEHNVITEHIKTHKAQQAHAHYARLIPSERAKAKVKAKR